MNVFCSLPRYLEISFILFILFIFAFTQSCTASGSGGKITATRHFRLVDVVDFMHHFLSFGKSSLPSMQIKLINYKCFA